MTPRPSAAWRRRTQAGCAPCATATWANRSSGSTWCCPTGRWCTGTARFGSDNTGYDLASLFVGAEGTLGVITGLDLRLHPTPTHRVTAICGFADLDDLVDAGREFRDMDGIAALELIDARASALTAEHLGVAAPVDGRLAAAHRTRRRYRPDRATGRRAGARAAGRASPRSVSTSTRSSGCGRSANRSPRSSACTARR